MLHHNYTYRCVQYRYGGGRMWTGIISVVLAMIIVVLLFTFSASMDKKSENRYKSRGGLNDGYTGPHSAYDAGIRNIEVTIYAATKYFSNEINDKTFLIGCPGFQSWCHISNDKNDYSTADAMNRDYLPASINSARNPKVPWVLFSQESPTNEKFTSFSNIINWTVTYRLDSDVPYPYGGFEKLSTPVDVDFNKIWTEKTASKPVTWLTSNCNTENKRKQIIQKIMDSGVEADLFDNCGRPVPRCGGFLFQGHDCVTKLMKSYKFYFAFENSNCDDYVTEKFYKTVGSRMAVPIVMIRKIYENVSLAAHINKVADDKEMYLEYHQCRKEYRVVEDDSSQISEKNEQFGFCGLCSKLKNGNLEPKTYGNIQDWHIKNKCDNNYLDKYL